jgi:hypothetical protein
MEASGCTPSLCIMRWKQDFTEVIVVNPALVRALKGHKTDARNSGWRTRRASVHGARLEAFRGQCAPVMSRGPNG